MRTVQKIMAVGLVGSLSATAFGGGTSIYGGYGFESPVFTVGSVDGQFGWTSTGAITPVVTQYMAHTGLQSLHFAQGVGDAVAEVRTEYGINNAGFMDNPVALIEFDILMLEGPSTDLEGALFLNVSGSQVAGGNDPLDTVGMIRFTGQTGIGSSGQIVRLDYGAWSRISIEVDLLNRMSALSIDGSESVDLAWGGGQVFENTLGGLFFQAINDNGFGGQFFIDNLSVNAVPAPSAMGVLSLGLLGIARRRR